MGVVVLTLGGALVLGLRSQVGDVETGPEMAATTTSGQALTAVAPPAWLGIEGADQLMSAGGGQSPSSTGDELIEPSPHEAGAIGDPGGRPLDPDAGEDDDPQTDTSTTTGPDAPTGVVITSVDPNGPSAQALQPGDVVLEVDGEPVTDMETLLTKLGAYQPGDQVEITYKASATGDVQTTSTAVVTLGARPEGLSVEGSAGQ